MQIINIDYKKIGKADFYNFLGQILIQYAEQYVPNIIKIESIKFLVIYINQKLYENFRNILSKLQQAFENKIIYFYEQIMQANALHQLKKYDDAIILCDKAIKLNPKHSEAFLNKATAFQFLQFYDDALKVLDELEIAVPNRAITNFNKGKIYESMLQNDKALEYYEKAFKQDPKSEALQYSVRLQNQMNETKLEQEIIEQRILQSKISTSKLKTKN